MSRHPERGDCPCRQRRVTTPSQHPPTSYAVGDDLNWESDLVPIHLVVELPFLLMMEPAVVTISSGPAVYPLLVAEGEVEVFAGAFSDSRELCGYQGNKPEAFESQEDIQDLGLPLIRRRQRTTVYFKARGHEDILRRALDIGPDAGSLRRLANSYLSTLCEAHLPILNELIRRYRLLSYDYFAYEVSAWDVPIWHVRGGPAGHISVQLFDYAGMTVRPRIFPNLLMPDKSAEERQFNYPLTLVDGGSIESMDPTLGVPGEDDLLDTRNLMERGDYSGAIRRTITAIESLVEHVLRSELAKLHDPELVEEKLAASSTDFPGRFRQWKKLSGVQIPSSSEKSLENSRQIRHEIVHRGRRITFSERGMAQKCVDTGRWMFNRIENDADRRDLREKKNTVRSIPRPTHAPVSC